MNSSTSISERAAPTRTASPLHFVATIAVVACVAFVAIASLPEDPYARFARAAAESPHYLRLRWIYERIHFDPTPIDVAFIGTSHTQSAIDSRIVESELALRGQELHVVNFAIPHLGRDLHWLLVRELLESRSVRELVIEVQDFEPRAPHPAFQRLARVDDLLLAPLIINSGLLDNVVRLPRRELDLFMPALTGKPPLAFDPAAYEGPHWDDTERLHGFSMNRDVTRSVAFLEQHAESLRRDLEAKDTLSRRLSLPNGCGLLTRYNRQYFEKILALARAKQVHVTFLYLPFFRGPEEPLASRYYRAYGDIITPRAVLADSKSWLNGDHLNVFGARQASKWMGETIVVGKKALTVPEGEAPCY